MITRNKYKKIKEDLHSRIKKMQLEAYELYGELVSLQGKDFESRIDYNNYSSISLMHSYNLMAIDNVLSAIDYENNLVNINNTLNVVHNSNKKE